MNITVLGLGYVGCISAGCLAQRGHRVFGVDVNPVKVDLINQGRSPIVEKHIEEIISEAVAAKCLSATTDVTAAIEQSDATMICVGTPSLENGSLDLQYIRAVAKDIGRALRHRDDYHVVGVRSTMLPGTMETVVKPLIEAESGKRAGEEFGMCINPEFLREGSAVYDYQHPPFTLIGAWHKRDGDLYESLYRDIDSPIIRTDVRTAEAVKYACNAFHALKVSFANEIGLFCKAMNIDSHEVMDIFVQDRQLNISEKYLRPGFAFGGSCLPKDLRAFLHKAKTMDLDLPVMQAILPSNDHHIDRAFRAIQQSGRKKVGILGLSFKAGTDDLRESPMVRLAERLLGKGYQLRIYDQNVSMAKVIGANRQFIEQVIPHISTLLVTDMDAVLTHAELLVVGNNSAEYRDIVRQAADTRPVIDLVRIEQDISQMNGHYQGICW